MQKHVSLLNLDQEKESDADITELQQQRHMARQFFILYSEYMMRYCCLFQLKINMDKWNM